MVEEIGGEGSEGGGRGSEGRSLQVILADRLRGSDGGNQAMLIGTLAHAVFQVSLIR